MPRTAGFDREHALRRAMDVFWRQGFRATSVRELTTATGLQPGSLYGAFGSKRGLFLAAIDVYFTDVEARVRTRLHDGRPPLARIRGFFDTLVDEALGDRESRGCLLVNTLLEIPAEDTEINRRVSGMFARVEKELRAVIEEARTRGELRAGLDPGALARTLVAGIYGLRVYLRTRPGAKALREVVTVLLSTLEADGASPKRRSSPAVRRARQTGSASTRSREA